MTEFLSIQEAADLLGYKSKRIVYNLFVKGILTRKSNGSTLYVDKDELIKFKNSDHRKRAAGIPLKNLKERLLEKIIINEKTLCWEWHGTRNKQGYGSILTGSRLDGTRKYKKSHRVSYELFVERIPDGYDVCHKCDNPRCINPEHLFAGTVKDNMRDMRQKGRQNDKRPKRTWGNVKKIV